MFGKPNHFTRKHLEEHGVSAPATVLEISERGMSVTTGNGDLVANTEVVLKTRLRVEPAGAPAFEVRQRVRYPQLSVPSVGARLTVVFDPDDHDKLMVDRDALPLLSESMLARTGMKDSALGGILETARAARTAHPGDPNAIADAVRTSLGIPDGSGPMVLTSPGLAAFGAFQPRSQEGELIANLERLAALRDTGVLTAEEFATQKAALLAGS